MRLCSYQLRLMLVSLFVVLSQTEDGRLLKFAVDSQQHQAGESTGDPEAIDFCMSNPPFFDTGMQQRVVSMVM